MMRDTYLAKNRRLVAKRYNEQLKIKASLANTLAAAVIISAVVFPLIREDNLSALISATTWFWLFFGFVLHWGALKLTSLLRSEE